MISKRNTTAAAGAVLALGSAALVSAGCTPPTPTCKTGQLAARFDYGYAGAGNRYEYWQLVNTGGTCRLNGYVSVVNLDGAGRPMRTKVADEPFPHTSVTLARRKHASWAFHYHVAQFLGCKPQNPAGMLLTPPGNTTALRVGPGIYACYGDLGVSPLTLGS